MSFDAHANLAYSTVATAPSPATSGTSLVVATGQGTRFPTAPFNATVWPANAQPTPSNAEIVRVTNVSTDTFTITRAQESTSARSIGVGDQIAATITKKTFTDVQNAIVGLNTVASSTATLTVDLANGPTQDITLSANCTISLTGATSGETDTLTLLLRQDATGGRTVTWPAAVTWLSGAAPTLKQAASAVDVVVLVTVDGGTTWLGSQAGGPAAVGSDGWVDDSSETWTYVSATSFKVAGTDVTTKYAKGTRIKLTQTTVKYFVVVASSFSTDTTVTITGGSDYSLANAAISANYHSYVSTPQGYPGTFAWTASPSGFSAITTNVARFSVVGNVCTCLIAVGGTSNATTKTFSLPVTTTANGSNYLYPIGFTKDNGTTATTPGRLALANSSLTATVAKDMAGAAWTASGACTYVCVFSFEF